MQIKNLFKIFEKEQGYDLSYGDNYYDGIWGNVLQVDITGRATDTFEQRVTLIDELTEIESKRLISEENECFQNGLIPLGQKWIAFDFDYGKDMLFDAIRFDLAYRRDERVPLQMAQKFHQLILADYTKDDTFIYATYDKSPWDRSLTAWSCIDLTDDWTFSLGIVLINSKKLTFCYFLGED